MSISEVLAYINVMFRELWIHKFKVLILGAVVAFSMLALGVSWKPKYDVAITIKAVNKNDVRTGGNVDDKARVVKDGMLSPQVLYPVIKRHYEEAKNADDNSSLLAELAQGVRNNISVSNLGTDYIKVEYSDSQAVMAKNIITDIADTFIRSRNTNRQEQTKKNFELLEEQRKQFELRLVEAEQNLEDFKKETSSDGTEEDARQKISLHKTEIENSELEIIDIRAQINSLNSQLRNESQTSIANLHREQIADLQSQRANLLLTVTEQHPDVIKINYQIQDAQDALAKSLNAVGGTSASQAGVFNPMYQQLRLELSSAERDLSSKLRRVDQQRLLLKQEQQRLSRIAQKATRLSSIIREYDTTKRNFDDILNRLQQARIDRNLNEEDALTYVVQEPPITPALPSGIHFSHFAYAGLILGVLIPLGVIFMYVFVDPRLRFVSELKYVLPESTQIMAIIPHELSPVGKRLVRKDILFLTIVSVLLLAAYFGVIYAYNQGSLNV